MHSKLAAWPVRMGEGQREMYVPDEDKENTKCYTQKKVLKIK